jgi:hypothetical protein
MGLLTSLQFPLQYERLVRVDLIPMTELQKEVRRGFGEPFLTAYVDPKASDVA